MAMSYALYCPDPEYPVSSSGSISCNNGSNLQLVPVAQGLGDLPWSDVQLLIGALLLSCTLATAYNLLSKMFYRG